ncbi:hypothetical protein CHS0354_004779 [Potamilus streckersoni]|uniref:G-protein coupled receptors family 1 profile domain-containing protein n=1 Tax=Potamilus streckersoni TaxID=2493646 RepID=A0AAE0TCZ7_9BIVA|nr:hypothetical protein CHS0354_004779 [Potamilus streckersoni]
MTNTTESIINGDFDGNDRTLVEISQLIRNISLPLIVIIGLLGNTVSLIVFSFSGLKSRSSSKFLSSLALTDNVILISILLSWIDDIIQYKSTTICSFRSEYRSLMEGITWVDTALTLVIPVTIIAIMNTRVVWVVIKFHRTRKQFRASNFVGQRKQKESPGTRTSSHSQLRVTRTLLLVSTTFVVLNLPSHLFKLYITVSQKTGGERSPTYAIYLIQEITQVLFYASFSGNFFLYTLSGKQFKGALCELIKSTNSRKRPDKCFGQNLKDLRMKQDLLHNTELKERYLKTLHIERDETESVLTISKAAHQ